MPKKIVQEEKMTITKSSKKAEGVEEKTCEETGQSKTFSCEPAKVQFSVGMTLNIGNYESTRVDVGVVLPCDPENVDETFEKAKNWATTRLVNEARTIKEFAASR